MKIIVGLGNPGLKYAGTRHNMGFMAMDSLAALLAVEIEQKKHFSLSAAANHHSEKLLLLKPQTFMNLSGEAVSDAVRFYKANIEDLLIVYDDMDIEPFELRFRRDGSAGGHNGMSSIIQHLGTEKINRLKIGIGHPVYNNTVDYVLQRFPAEELPKLAETTKTAANAILCWCEAGIIEAMNKYN